MTSISIDTHGLRWFDDSPDASDPTCICSHCGLLIRSMAIRMWNAHNQEARLHMQCFNARSDAPMVALPDEDEEEGIGEPSALCCSHCGMELEWTDCDACDDGQVDVYDIEPLWYSPGDTEPCQQCGGDGGWLSCPNAGEAGHGEEREEETTPDP